MSEETTTRVRTEFVWRGEWSEVIAWLDELSGGRFQLPFGSRPPIIRSGDDLELTNRTGTEWVTLGGTVFLDTETGEFHSTRGPAS